MSDGLAELTARIERLRVASVAAIAMSVAAATTLIGIGRQPLCASLADWLGKPPSQSGLGLGDGTVAGLATLAIAALVAYVGFTRRDVQPASSEVL